MQKCLGPGLGANVGQVGEVRMALRGQVSGRGGPTGRSNGTQRHGVQRDRQWPGAAQSLDLEEGRLGSEKELGHLTKGHEGQGE